MLTPDLVNTPLMFPLLCVCGKDGPAREGPAGFVGPVALFY
jgi:hypothetical protein